MIRIRSMMIISRDKQSLDNHHRHHPNTTTYHFGKSVYDNENRSKIPCLNNNNGFLEPNFVAISEQWRKSAIFNEKLDDDDQ